MTDPDWSTLDAAWARARAAGVIGGDTTEELVNHAAGYVPAAWSVLDSPAGFRGVDLGTGAGIPGVPLALLFPRSTWRLLDAGERRCDLARDVVDSMSLTDRVEVIHGRVDDMAHRSEWRKSADLVVARSFGPPGELAECALPLLGDRGILVVSVTHDTRDRWERGQANYGGCFEIVDGWTSDAGQYLAIRALEIPTTWPRRAASRTRAPLF